MAYLEELLPEFRNGLRLANRIGMTETKNNS